jgi:arsenate reductase
MKRVYYLSTCDTCKKILEESAIADPDFELIDIKSSPMEAAMLDKLAGKVGSYEALLNKRARKLKEQNVVPSECTEDELRALILEEYTFLKRPVVIIGEQVFIGNAKKNTGRTQKNSPFYIKIEQYDQINDRFW